MKKATFIGHSTVLIEIAGARILTDPFIRNSPLHLKRETGPVEDHLLENIDAVLISHHHQDHLDFKSLKKIKKEIIIGCPETESVLKSRSLNALDLHVGQSIEIKGAKITAVKALHPHRKNLPFKRATGDAVGFLIEEEKKIYFAGDTDLFPEMSELKKENIDLAFLPIWGWGPNLGPGHLDPKTAARAADIISPKKAIPIHWGTYFPRVIKKGREKLIEPGAEFKQEVMKLTEDVDVEILQPGSSTTL